ncbi:MAG: hypothetical protein ACE14L_11300 [Terriglobales bacterium]
MMKWKHTGPEGMLNRDWQLNKAFFSSFRGKSLTKGRASVFPRFVLMAISLADAAENQDGVVRTGYHSISSEGVSRSLKGHGFQPCRPDPPLMRL